MERGVKRRTERVDDALPSFGDALQAADPLAAIAQRAGTLDSMRTLKGGGEEVPWKRIQ